MENESPSRTLAELLLVGRGVTLDDYVAELRKEGLGWRRIAQRLEAEHAVSVSWMSLYRWYRDDESSAA